MLVYHQYQRLSKQEHTIMYLFDYYICTFCLYFTPSMYIVMVKCYMPLFIRRKDRKKRPRLRMRETHVLCPGVRMRKRTWRRAARLALPDSETHRQRKRETVNSRSLFLCKTSAFVCVCKCACVCM